MIPQFFNLITKDFPLFAFNRGQMTLTRTKMKCKKTVEYRATRAWNRPPSDIWDIKAKPSFKKLIEIPSTVEPLLNFLFSVVHYIASFRSVTAFLSLAQDQSCLYVITLCCNVLFMYGIILHGRLRKTMLNKCCLSSHENIYIFE